MFQYTEILPFFSFFLFLSLQTCKTEHGDNYEKPVVIPVKTDIETKATLEGAFNTHSETTRKVLITFCGSCHQSSLETHKPAAIAIFDLDKGEDWHKTLVKHHIKGIENRIQNKNPITEEQQKAIIAFLELKESQL